MILSLILAAGLFAERGVITAPPNPPRQMTNAEMIRDCGAVVSNGVLYVAGTVETNVPNPAYTRYWWLYSIAQKYGLALPCNIADLRLAMYAATTEANKGDIALDAADALACFFGNGGAEFDWSKAPSETITKTVTIMVPVKP